MSLTFQPFAENEQLEKLGTELRENVGEPERMGSIACGVALALAGVPLGGAARWLAWIAATAFVYRGATGHCGLYDRLGINTHDSNQGTTH